MRSLLTTCVIVLAIQTGRLFVHAQDLSDENDSSKAQTPQEQLEAARRLLIAANDPAERDLRDGRLQECRQLISAARQVLSESVAQDELSLREYPAFIPFEEVDMRVARQRVETQLMSNQLAHAQCHLLEAELPGEKDVRKRLFDAAFVEYEQLHRRYRSQVAGLYARLMQGKCSQETGDLRIALGIYEELLGHEGISPSLVGLKDRALQFRLECLNSDERKDFKLVEQEGATWLAENFGRAGSSSGLAIRWELCRALAALGRDPKCTDEERDGYLKRALEMSEELNHATDDYKSGTRQLIDQIQQELNGEAVPSDPTTT